MVIAALGALGTVAGLAAYLSAHSNLTFEASLLFSGGATAAAMTTVWLFWVVATTLPTRKVVAPSLMAVVAVCLVASGATRPDASKVYEEVPAPIVAAQADSPLRTATPSLFVGLAHGCDETTRYVAGCYLTKSGDNVATLLPKYASARGASDEEVQCIRANALQISNDVLARNGFSSPRSVGTGHVLVLGDIHCRGDWDGGDGTDPKSVIVETYASGVEQFARRRLAPELQTTLRSIANEQAAQALRDSADAILSDIPRGALEVIHASTTVSAAADELTSAIWFEFRTTDGTCRTASLSLRARLDRQGLISTADLKHHLVRDGAPTLCRPR